MSGILVVVLVFFGLAAGLAGVAYFTYQRKLRRAKAIERGLKMVPILIHLPPPSSDTASGSRDIREVMREKTAQAEVLYNLLAGTATEGFKSTFYGQRHIALELIVVDGLVHFFAAVPVALVSVVKQALTTAYPGARLEEVEDYNIFNQEGRLAATLGGEMVLRVDSAYPIATYEKLERDPMEALLTTVSALEKADGVAIQLMLRPAGSAWVKQSIRIADAKRKGRPEGLKFTPMDILKALVKAPEERHRDEQSRLGSGVNQVSNLEQGQVASIEEKTQHPGFEVLIRVIVSTGSVARSQQLLRDISTTFALFEAPGLNGFKFLPALDVQGLVTAFIFRFFPPQLKNNVLSSAELATLFHLPDSQFTPSASVSRQQSKQVDGPVQMPTVGLLFGYNEFRGVKKEIRLSPEDRRRHTYILGQTGTGKSTMLENLAVQDMLSGNGFAFIDPHGDSAEKLLALVPKERAEDVIYFNPADTQYPLGLNLFEFTDPAQKDFLVQETINMLYKLYDPGHTGIIGPRYEHWYRNAALTLMSDPTGATFIEIPKVFTDTEYLKQKFKYLKDPTVIDFWTKEMGQTSDYHKSEMLGWFVSKFGAFQNNEMMRNIIGQTKSAFDIREVMDKKKILIVNLSKGRIGELNSQLLGMIFVIKFQAAAMSRADVPEDQRPDFALYVDEFQNFSTDSFASILSEARKYRLNLIVANQFIGQLSNEIRDAVFGNIGTIVAHRMGPDDAEFMVKQFAPVFDASDLVNIPNYNAAMRLMIGGLPSQPFSVHDSAPLGSANAEMGLAIKQLSAAKYGHDKAVVEADILRRFSGRPAGGAAPASVPAPAAVGAPGTPAPAPVAAAPGAMDASGATGAPSAPATTGAPAPVMAPGAAPVPGSLAPGVASVPAGAGPGMAAPVMPLASAAPAGGALSAPGAVQPLPANVPPPSSVALATATEPVPVQPPAPAPAAPVMPAAAPVPAPLAVPAAMPGMAAVPPPIGAPPIGAPPVPAPFTPMAPDPIFSAPAPSSDRPQEPAASAVDDFSAMNPSVAAPAAGVAPAVPGGAMAPPPIGAPPVDLPGPPPREPNATLPSALAPNTLSLSDITGQKPSRDDAQPHTYLDDVPVLGEPVAMPAGAAAQPLVGDGRPLEGDPYANIDVMGEGAPVAAGAAPESVPASSEVPVGDGTPLPDDPYGEIDILGEPTAPSAPQSNPQLAAAPLEDLWPEPMLGAPRSRPQPAAAATQPAPAQPVQPPRPAVATPPPPPAAPIAPGPVAASALRDEPLPAPPPVEAVRPLQMPRVDAAQPLPSEPAPLVEPEPRETPQTAPYRPEPSQPEPEPLPVEPRSPVPAEPDSDRAAASVEPEPLANESLIHFVDPEAESLMNRPDEPDQGAKELNDKPSMNGLPEGVQLMDSTAADKAAAPAAIPPAVPDSTLPLAQVELAASLSGAKPEPAPEESSRPVAEVALRPSLAAAAPAPAQSPQPVAPELVAAPALEQPKAANASEPSDSNSEIETARAHIAALKPAPAPAPAPPPVEVPSEPAPVPVLSPAVAAPEAASAPEPAPPSAVPQPQPPATPSPAPVPPSSAPAEPEPVSKPALTPEPVVAEPAPVSAPEPTPAAPVELKQPEPAAVPAPTQPSDAASLPAAAPAASPAPAREPSDKPATSGVSGAAQIKNMEHQIDDLLSVSLIHSDNSPTHRRLPEPVAATKSEDESGADLELGVRNHGVSPESDQEDHPAVHHGLKVIQPLEPIVPPKERFAKELAELNRQQGGDAVKAPTPAMQVAPVRNVTPPPPPPTAPPKAPQTAQPPSPPRPPVAPPEVKPQPKPPISPAVKPALPKAPLPPVVADFDEGLPKAESLAASDVAKARLEARPEPASVPAPVAKVEPKTPEVRPEPEKPEVKPAPKVEAAEIKTPEPPSPPAIVKHAEPMLPPEPASEAVDKDGADSRGGSKRRRRRGGRGSQKPAEHIESTEEAEHNEPSEAAAEAASLTGQLILPSGEKTKSDPEKPAGEKPKKLAPGEVYVDDAGNVMIGE